MAGKKTPHQSVGTDSSLKDANRRRLRRIEGQIRGLQKMLDEGRDCTDIIVQISSVQEALRGVARTLVKNHLLHCASKKTAGGKPAETELMYDELVGMIYTHLR